MKVSFWQCSYLLSFLLLSFEVPANAKTGEELAVIYEEALSLFSVFPPLDSDPDIWKDESTRPIEVVVGTNILSIDDISPGASEFTVTSRVFLYWKASDCNQTETHQAACASAVRNVRFASADNLASTPKISLRLEVDNIHEIVFEENNQTDLQPNAELTEAQTTFRQQFDMRYYPYEVHGLEVSLTSLYSTEVVNLTPFPNLGIGRFQPSVPAGWEYIGATCGTTVSDGNVIVDDLTGNDSENVLFSSYQCTIWVSRENPGWWLTSFFLHAGVIFIAFSGTVGMMSHGVAEARDDRDAARRALFDGTRLIGTYTMGLLLTYVFQVEVSPYGQSIEFWPRTPASTMIYSLGLATIFTQAVSGMIASFIFKRPLLSEGFVGSPMNPYDLNKVPKEGEVGEDRSPLILKKYDPAPGQSYQDALKEGETKEAAVEETMAPIRIDRIRVISRKGYNVLSVSEAGLIQSFVRRVFFFKVTLLCASYFCAMIILVVAKRRRNDVIEDVVASLPRFEG